MAGLAMIPWVFILACSLPPAVRAAHWPAAWAGLDALEAAGLMATGVALIGRYRWLCLPAAVTSTLLVIDAWFDITTSAPGPAATVAIAMAIFPELPMAGLCAVLAIRHAPHAWRLLCPAVCQPTASRGSPTAGDSQATFHISGHCAVTFRSVQQIVEGEEEGTMTRPGFAQAAMRGNRRRFGPPRPGPAWRLRAAAAGMTAVALLSAVAGCGTATGSAAAPATASPLVPWWLTA
jgi:hypothetical protein